MLVVTSAGILRHLGVVSCKAKRALTLQGAVTTVGSHFCSSEVRLPLPKPCQEWLLALASPTALRSVQINSKLSAKHKHLLAHQPSLAAVILLCTSGRE